jgi:hypothetical protein
VNAFAPALIIVAVIVGALLVKAMTGAWPGGREVPELAEAVAQALAASEGAEILAVTEPGGARCEVCGTAILASPARCASCGTPHHADCWRYNRGCSTYACGGTERRR